MVVPCVENAGKESQLRNIMLSKKKITFCQV